MKRIYLLFLGLLIACIANAQKTTITGIVLDLDNFGLPAAEIKLDPINRYTFSDATGKFEFLDVPKADSYVIEVHYIGYESQSQNVVYEEDKNEVHLKFVLKEGVRGMETVLIIGDRLKGQAKALNQQKNNQNITNVVSSDQVGRFPDANIGDAMKRIPGITMQNDQGEARNIIIRGIAPSLNSVTINGDRIPSAEGDNRNIQMDLIPSDMIQTIEVNKTLTSDMDADAIGGSVNLATRATPNGERISATLSGGYNPIRNGALYSGGFVYGNRFLDNKFGMVLSTSYNKNIYGSDNVEAVWVKDDFGNVYIDEHDIRKYDVTRTRRSFSGAFDYKFNNRHSLVFNAMYNWRDDRENRYRYRIRGIDPIYDEDDETKIVGYEGDIRRQTKGGINNNSVKNARLEQQTVQNFSLRGDHLIGSNLDMDWALSYSTAREYRPNERYIEYQAKGVEFDSDFGTPQQPIYTPTEYIPNYNYELRDLSENTDNTKEGELGAKVNFRVPLSIIDGQKGRLRLGGRLRLKNKLRDNLFTAYEPTDSEMDNMNIVPLVEWEGTNWNPNPKYVPGRFVNNEFLGNLDFNNKNKFDSEEVPSEYLALNYNARETITAGYVRWDQDFSSQLSMIAGIRLENTGLNYEGNVIRDEEELEGTRTIQNSYLNVLPSLAFKYDATDKFVLRAAFTTAIARPNYYTLSPFVSTVIDDTEIQAGNPNLKAAYSWNYDLMAEYYFKSVGLISGGIFYKNIKNFIYTFRDEKYSASKFDTDFPDLSNPIPTGEDDWTFIQSRNGDNVNVFGFEAAIQRQLDFLPGNFLKNFGIYLNYTFTKSSAKGIYNEDGDLREGIMLPGTAPHMFNTSLSWENKNFSARISLNYAAAYLDELGGSDFDDRYYDKQTFIDFNVAYKFAKHVRVFAEANNLTNQPLRYYQGISSRTMQMEYYRQRYNIGLKFDLNR